MQKLRNIPGLVDLDSSVKPDKPTLEVVVDRTAAAEWGLSVGALGSQLRRWVAGEVIGNWRAPDDQTYDVIVRLPPSGRNTESDIAALPMALPAAGNDGGNRVIRLDQVAQVVPGTGPNQINRRDLLRDEEALEAFFDARIPPHVFDGPRFETWRTVAERDQHLLRAERRDAERLGDGHRVALDDLHHPVGKGLRRDGAR